MAGGIIQNKV